MPQPLTTTERAIYEYLLDFLSEHTYQPSVREIGRRFEIKSTKTVSQLLHAIADKGYIELDPARSRGVRLLGYESTRTIQPVPVFERVGRDGAVPRPELRSRYITVDRCFLPSSDTFFVRAGDDGMAARGVMRGDFVLVRPGVPDGDGILVAARHGEEAVVRLLGTRDGVRVLTAASGGLPEIPARATGTGAVLGEVCADFRSLRNGKAH